ncbi:hypothetical protein [Actinoplanes sp. HUAS TT8]|uniref:hypothetical protein n=1 Tax=Actinoplanes sp. HUAS TT8 TaxID=3447453 RepID=UPI003F528861
MTYPPQQPPLPPPQDPYVSYPPTQPYTDPYGQAGSVPGYAAYEPGGRQAPPRRPLWPWLAAVAALSLALVAGGGWILYDRVLREDSGVAACKSLAAGEKTGPASSGDDTLTRDEYLRMRKIFADSHYADLREHGTKLMDILWQVSQIGTDNEAAAMAYLQPLTEHVSGLQSACADHGVIIDLKLTD